jgi:hypothetical protein
LSIIATAGIMGNVYVESFHTFSPREDSLGCPPNVPTTGCAFGAFQFGNGGASGGQLWTAFVDSKYGGSNRYSLVAQCAFVLSQLTTSVRASLNLATSPEVAAALFMADFEKPGYSGTVSRIFQRERWAWTFFDIYGLPLSARASDPPFKFVAPPQPWS